MYGGFQAHISSLRKYSGIFKKRDVLDENRHTHNNFCDNLPLLYLYLKKYMPEIFHSLKFQLNCAQSDGGSIKSIQPNQNMCRLLTCWKKVLQAYFPTFGMIFFQKDIVIYHPTNSCTQNKLCVLASLYNNLNQGKICIIIVYVVFKKCWLENSRRNIRNNETTSKLKYYYSLSNFKIYTTAF